MTFDHDLGVKITRNISQYTLHHMTYAATNFEVASYNGLGGDTFTRNVTGAHIRNDRRTDGQTDDEPTLVRNQYTLFAKEKADITRTCT